MHLRRFAGLIPPDSVTASKLVSPPYDVVTRTTARDLLNRGECTFLRVVRPDATLPDNLAEDEDSIITASTVALDSLQESRTLVRASTPSIFVYELRIDDHVQRGVAALVSIDDYIEKVIRRHEHTRIEKELQRAALADALDAHTGPVLLTYRDNKTIFDAVAETVTSREADLRVVQNGVTHSVWQCEENCATVIEREFKTVPASYIADGHHRAASAMRVGIGRRAKAGTQMERKSDWFPAVLFPASELRSRPYYRIVRDLGSVSDVTEFIKKIELANVKVIRLPERPVADAKEPGVVYMALCENESKGKATWFALNLPSNKTDVDSQILQDNLLAPVMGVVDPRTDERVDFVGGVGLDELDRLVSKGDATVAFAPCAVSAELMMEVVDTGKMMPPKSTWFEPKLCSGFFVHMFSARE